jgi:internalin A
MAGQPLGIDSAEGKAEAERRIEEAHRSGNSSLTLKGLGLRELPESLSGLTGLQRLFVESNGLTALPEWLGGLTGLQTLVASGNELTALPDRLGGLTGLRELFVSGNKLTALPDRLGGLTGLQTLSVAGNGLTALPEWLGGLTGLQTLVASGNELTALPDRLGGLTGLRELVVSGNRLTALPESLKELKSLDRLFLHQNPGLGLPPEVLGPPWEDVAEKRATAAKPADILEYYFRLRGCKRPLNEAKLTLVGRGGVGKTSLVNRLVRWSFNPDESRTEGIQITPWNVEVGDKKDLVRLNIWDFGGQEIMHATHQFFLTQRSLYLLVLNAREGEQDANIDYWLRMIESFGGESPVIVVINKIKAHPFDLNRNGLRAKFPAIRAFVQTDCEDGTGLDELGRLIREQTDRLEHLRDPFPAAWFGIKTMLADLTEPYITYEKYREFCAAHGETDPQGQDALVGFQHHLGIVLNFKDDPRLQHTHVLRPEWVTSGIYKLLNRASGADLRIAQLSDVLDRT